MNFEYQICSPGGKKEGAVLRSVSNQNWKSARGLKNGCWGGTCRCVVFVPVEKRGGVRVPKTQKTSLLCVRGIKKRVRFTKVGGRVFKKC